MSLLTQHLDDIVNNQRAAYLAHAKLIEQLEDRHRWLESWKDLRANPWILMDIGIANLKIAETMRQIEIIEGQMADLPYF